MLPYRDSRFIKILLGIFFVLALGYAYYEARGLLFGPSIALPSETLTVHERLVTIRGTAARIAQLRVNGAPVPVTEEGAFEEPYLLAPGINRIILDATDTYGRAVQHRMTIVYEPDATLEEPKVASSTDQTASSTSKDVAPDL